MPRDITALAAAAAAELCRSAKRRCPMALEIRFARDAHGKPTASSPPPIEAVGAYFEREVGPDPGQGDWVLEAIDDVLTGRETGAPDVGTKHNHSSVIIDSSCGGFVEVCCDLGESGGPYQDVQ